MEILWTITYFSRAIAMMHLFSRCSLTLFSGKHLLWYFNFKWILKFYILKFILKVQITLSFVFFFPYSGHFLKVQLYLYFQQDLWRLYCKEFEGQWGAKKSTPVPARQTADGGKASGFFLQADEEAEILVILTVKAVYWGEGGYFYFLFYCEIYFIVFYLKSYRCTFFMASYQHKAKLIWWLP